MSVSDEEFAELVSEVEDLKARLDYIEEETGIDVPSYRRETPEP